jgi:SAM-dependent methyltransferase
MMQQKKQTTSWGNVALWYHTLLKNPKGTYQHDVILPNILRLLGAEKGNAILDVACGSGFFAREFAKTGAQVFGTDISSELIAFAKHEVPGVAFSVAPADAMSFVKEKSMDAVTIILAIQNIENMAGVFAECSRVLKPKGRLLIVLNHPAFRVPKASEWGWDEEHLAQYRRVDAYLSDARVKIDMHPGDDPSIHTWSFHRPLQTYMKALQKQGFCLARMEEWISNRQGPKGRKFAASERARKEIPLFLFLEAVKCR